MEVFVGTFTEKQLRNKEDRAEIDKTAKETGLKYIRNLITEENGETVMKVWATDKF